MTTEAFDLNAKMAEPEDPKNKRVLERRLHSSLTGAVYVSRVVMVLPATRYAGYLKEKWVDVTDGLSAEEIAAVPMPSWFDGM